MALIMIQILPRCEGSWEGPLTRPLEVVMIVVARWSPGRWTSNQLELVACR